MNKTRQMGNFISRSCKGLELCQKWVDVSLEGFYGSLDTSDEALLCVCFILIGKIKRTLLKLHEWLEENPDSPDYPKVVYQIKYFKKLLASWSSGNIIK